MFRAAFFTRVIKLCDFFYRYSFYLMFTISYTMYLL